MQILWIFKIWALTLCFRCFSKCVRNVFFWLWHSLCELCKILLSIWIKRWKLKRYFWKNTRYFNDFVKKTTLCNSKKSHLKCEFFIKSSFTQSNCVFLSRTYFGPTYVSLLWFTQIVLWFCLVILPRITNYFVICIVILWFFIFLCFFLWFFRYDVSRSKMFR